MRVIFFTERGERAAEELKRLFSARLYRKGQDDLKEFVKCAFEVREPIVFISALPIAVRLIAPYIKSKESDSAVIVMDELCRYVIPVLSNHLGRGGEIAKEIAENFGATCIMTTATDINGVFAADSWGAKLGCAVGDIRKIAPFSMALLRGEEVGFFSDFPIKGEIPPQLVDKNAKIGMAVSFYNKSPFDTTLHIVPKRLVIGAGCRKNLEIEVFHELFTEFLTEHDINIKAVSLICSIELKKDEPCMVRLAQRLGVPFKTASREELLSLSGDFSRSEFVKSVTGVDCVCERAAVFFGKDLIFKKWAKNGATFACAALPFECDFTVI